MTNNKNNKNNSKNNNKNNKNNNLNSSSSSQLKINKETELISRKEEKKEENKENKEEENENEENENEGENESLLPLKPLILTIEEKKLLNSTLEDDLYEVLKDVKYFAPLSAILFSLIGIYFALDPFTAYPKRPTPMTHDEFVSYLKKLLFYLFIIYLFSFIIFFINKIEINTSCIIN